MNKQDDQMVTLSKKHESLQSQDNEMQEKLTTLVTLAEENKEIKRIKKDKLTTDAEHQKAIAFRDSNIYRNIDHFSKRVGKYF